MDQPPKGIDGKRYAYYRFTIINIRKSMPLSQESLMSCHRARRFCSGAAAIFVWTAAGTIMASAESSTSRGQISVAQVRAMLDQAATSPTARQTLAAYLAGAGETAGWLIDTAARNGSSPSCTRPLSLDDKTARQALQGSAPGLATETAATPLIVDDMLKRAGCRLAER